MKVRIIETGETTIKCESIEKAKELYYDGEIELETYVRYEEVMEEQ